MNCDLCFRALTKDSDKPPIASHQFSKSFKLVGKRHLFFRRCRHCKTSAYYVQVELFGLPPVEWPPVKEVLEVEYLESLGRFQEEKENRSTGSEYSRRVSRGADTYPSEYA